MHQETAIVCAARFYMRRLQGLTCMYNKKKTWIQCVCVFVWLNKSPLPRFEQLISLHVWGKNCSGSRFELCKGICYYSRLLLTVRAKD